jgi:FkbM family methyltransferase
MERKVAKNHITFTVKGSNEHWDAFENDSWEANTFDLLDKYLRNEDTMVDVGAWIGPIALYAGHKVKACYAFEPDPVAFAEFRTNLSLNPVLSKRVYAINKAITTDGKNVKLFARWNHGDSGSSLLKRVKSQNSFVEAESMTFEDVVKTYHLGAVDFIKMDIEGGEFFILPAILDFLKDNRPTLLVSFHYASLLEYYELRYFPLSPLRRLYRILDPGKSWIKNRVHHRFQSLIESLSFYKVYDEHGNFIPPQNLTDLRFEQLDMLLFTNRPAVNPLT